jgi:hypothetical protein
MRRFPLPVPHAVAGLLLLSGVSPSSAQYQNQPLPYHTGVLGNWSSYTPGYGAPPPYRPPAPAPAPGYGPPGYSSGAPYAPSAPAPSYPPAAAYPPWGYYPQSRFGSTLQGYASLTQATGQYWQDIQQARITREQSRQMALDTQKKQIELEMWYEKNRPTALTMAKSDKASQLQWARYDAQSTQIWDGRPLNVLLQSIFLSPDPGRGPYLSLDQSTLRGLNFTDKTTRGNLALAKNDGSITWTDALLASTFDDLRNRFGMNFAKAITIARTGKTPPRDAVLALRTDLDTMSTMLDDEVQTLTPDDYIGARRLLNQLKNTIKGLSNPLLCKGCDDTWKKNVHTVSDLVTYCLKNGLEFGPAVAPGDYACYTAAYYAIRDYERGIWQTASR